MEYIETLLCYPVLFSEILEEYYKTTDMYLKELNYKFVKDFEVYLHNHKSKDHQKPLANNGVMKHIIS